MMTPRQLREEIETIDQRLEELRPWEANLTEARKRYLVDDAADVVDFIEHGRRYGRGRPDDPDLVLFDRGWPGLKESREEIADLKERRALLVEQQPTDAETAERIREADVRAKDIRARSEVLTGRMTSVESAINEAGRLALALAEDTRRLCEDNGALDKLTSNADIPRPNTPRLEAAKFPMAMPLSALLGGYFHGGQPGWLEHSLVRDIRVALGASERHGESVAT